MQTKMELTQTWNVNQKCMGSNNTQGTYREAISVDNLTRFQTHTLHCPGDTVHVNSTAKVYHTCTSPISPSDVILNSIHFQLMFLHSNFTFCLFQSAFSLKPKTGRLRIQFLGKVHGNITQQCLPRIAFNCPAGMCPNSGPWWHSP